MFKKATFSRNFSVPRRILILTLFLGILLIFPLGIAKAWEVVTVSLLNGITGTGTLVQGSYGYTATSAQYYYQKAHGKGYGINNGTPYCVDQRVASGYWLTSVQTSLIQSSYSGGKVAKHYWSWSTGQSNTKYTSSDGAHSTASFFNSLTNCPNP